MISRTASQRLGVIVFICVVGALTGVVLRMCTSQGSLSPVSATQWQGESEVKERVFVQGGPDADVPRVEIVESSGLSDRLLMSFKNLKGESIAGVQVYLADGEELGRAGADGTLSIPQRDTGSTTLLCVHSEYVPARVAVTPEITEGQELRVTLDAGTALTGVVADQDGAPLAGVSVIVKSNHHSNVPYSASLECGLNAALSREGETVLYSRLATSQADGVFLVSALVNAPHLVSLEKPGYIMASTEGQYLKSVSLELTDTAHAELSMSEVYVACLQIIDQSGEIVSDTASVGASAIVSRPDGTGSMLRDGPLWRDMLGFDGTVGVFAAPAKRGSRLGSKPLEGRVEVLAWNEPVYDGIIIFAPATGYHSKYVRRVRLPADDHSVVGGASVGWVDVRCSVSLIARATDKPAVAPIMPKKNEHGVLSFEVRPGAYSLCDISDSALLPSRVLRADVRVRAGRTTHVDLGDVQEREHGAVNVRVFDESNELTTDHHVQFRGPRGTVGFRGHQRGSEFSVDCMPGDYRVVLIDETARLRDSVQITVTRAHNDRPLEVALRYQ